MQVGRWNSTDRSLVMHDDGTNGRRQQASTRNVTYIVTTIEASTSSIPFWPTS